jgi:hypothetical protein
MTPYIPNFNPQKQKPANSVCGPRQLTVNSRRSSQNVKNNWGRFLPYKVIELCTVKAPNFDSDLLLFVPVEVSSPDESQNKNFDIGTLQTWILHARSIFFKGGHPTKIWRKKIFFMKTLSKLGALTVYDGIL